MAPPRPPNPPNPPPAPTYLDSWEVAAHLRRAEREPDPETSEARYRTVTAVVLRFLFPSKEGYSVAQEDSKDINTPDLKVLKMEKRPRSSIHFYDFLMVEYNRAGTSWEAAEDQCSRHCENTLNESNRVYAMIQVEQDLKFYEWRDASLTGISDIVHLQDNAQEIVEWAAYLKSHPFPFSLVD